MLFPKPVRRVLFLIVLAVVSYYGYHFVRTQISQEVIAFKSYAKALFDGEPQRARELIAGPLAEAPFRNRGAREEALEGGEVRLVYYKVRKKDVGEEGRVVRLFTTQIIRYDPPGADPSFWGRAKIVNHQEATLVRDKSRYQVERYSDRWFTPGVAE